MPRPRRKKIEFQRHIFFQETLVTSDESQATSETQRYMFPPDPPSSHVENPRYAFGN